MRAVRPLLLVGGAAGVLGVAIGWALFGTGTTAPAGSDAFGATGSAGADADVVARLARLQAEHDDLRAAFEELRARNTAREPVDRSDPLRDADRPGAGESPSAGTGPVVSFGIWADEPALRTADWADMGRRARDLVRARGSGIGGRQPPEQAAREKKSLRELRARRERIEAQRPDLAGHPVVLVNLMASHLERAGQPFQPWQIETIEAAGRRYEARAERLHHDLLSRDDAFATEKKLRSIQLRKAVVDEIVDEVLSREQWDVLFDPETKGLLYYDVYQVGGLELERPHSSVYWRNVRADAKEHLQLFLLTEWEIPRDDVDRLEGLVDQWIAAIMALPRHEGHPSSALHMDEVLPCCEVHVEHQKRVAAALAQDRERSKQVRENAVFVVFPRLRSGQ